MTPFWHGYFSFAYLFTRDSRMLRSS